MWDIKQKKKLCTNSSSTTNKTHWYRQQKCVSQRCRGVPDDNEGKGGQIPGDRMRLDFEWWVHNRVYSCCIKKLYTWNVYNVINQCYPYTFSNKNKSTLKEIQ